MPAKATSPHGPRKRARRRLIIDAGFQLRELLPLFIFAALYAALLGVLFFILYRNANADPDFVLRAVRRAQMGEVQLGLWPLLGVAGLLAAFVSLPWSLRVAGPVYRLHQALNQLAEGEFKPLRFRRRDEFHILEEDVALLNQKMKLIASRNRDILYSVHAHVRKLSDRLAADEIIPRADLEEAIRTMRVQLEKAPEISLAGRR